MNRKRYDLEYRKIDWLTDSKPDLYVPADFYIRINKSGMVGKNMDDRINSLRLCTKNLSLRISIVRLLIILPSILLNNFPEIVYLSRRNK